MVKTKAYTIIFLYKEIARMNGKRVNNYKDLVAYMSPIAGARSAKIRVLNKLLGGKLKEVVAAGEEGKTIKSRLLLALLKRKRLGFY